MKSWMVVMGDWNRSARTPSIPPKALALLKISCLAALCFLLIGCDLNFVLSGLSGNAGKQCQGNCIIGGGARGLSVFVEPEAGPAPLVDAIRDAQKSVQLEMYLLSNRNIIRALEEDANRGIVVRVMLEAHPYGNGPISASKTLDELRAAGVQAQYSNPTFALTHAKCMLIDNRVAYIMTSNFSNSALGTGKYAKNREYDIIDSNAQDVQAVSTLFQADWDHSNAIINDPNLVVSPLNARHAFTTLIGSARHTLLIEAEEMNDSGIEQALINAARHGVLVQVVLPMSDNAGDSNSNGSATLKQEGIAVREDPRLYMHAKMIIIDGIRAFVGSENISAQSLDQNREVGIIVSDESVLNTLQQTFQTDWGQSQNV